MTKTELLLCWMVSAELSGRDTFYGQVFTHIGGIHQPTGCDLCLYVSWQWNCTLQEHHFSQKFQELWDGIKIQNISHLVVTKSNQWMWCVWMHVFVHRCVHMSLCVYAHLPLKSRSLLFMHHSWIFKTAKNNTRELTTLIILYVH